MLELEWHPETLSLRWADACDHAKALGDGWRMPTVSELVSLWDYDAQKCRLDDAKGWHWSGSMADWYAWAVHLSQGHVNDLEMHNENKVRLVREVSRGT